MLLTLKIHTEFLKEKSLKNYSRILAPPTRGSMLRRTPVLKEESANLSDEPGY